MEKTPNGSDNQESLAEAVERTQKIAQLNDNLRRTGQGGQIVATQGIASLPQETQLAITGAIKNFTNFEPDNDPYGEHDFGAVTIEGMRIFWKIDYYAQDMMHLSPDASDPSVTNRVMTIMRAEEY